VSANRYNIHVALVEEQRRMTNASRRTAAIVWLMAALTIGPPASSFADPTETKPEAAANDPDYAAGDVARAEEHLAALRKICLLPCEELGDLEREIAAYKKKSGAVRTP
jgi:hypothetical protein